MSLQVQAQEDHRDGRSMPTRQPNSAYTCQVFTDQGDHRMLERFYRDYKPDDVSALPSFILGMDRLVSDFRARYNPDQITDGDAANLDADAEEAQPADPEGEEDEVLPDPTRDQGGEPPSEPEESEAAYLDDNGNPVDAEGNPIEASASVIAAARRFQAQAQSIPLPQDQRERLIALFKKYHASMTNALVLTKENSIVIGTTVNAMYFDKMKKFEEGFREIYPEMGGLMITLSKGRLAFKISL